MAESGRGGEEGKLSLFGGLPAVLGLGGDAAAAAVVSKQGVGLMAGHVTVSRCPVAQVEGGIATVPTPQLFPRDHSSTVVWIRVGSPVCPSSSCHEVERGGGRDVVLLAAWLGHRGSVPCLSSPSSPSIPWLTQGCRWGGAASSLPHYPAAVLTWFFFGSPLSSRSSPAPAPDPAPLTPRSSHPADPPPLRDAACRPCWHQQRLGAAGAFRGAGGPGPASGQR